ncbi:hypothetical protein HUK83_02995 [Endobacter medicaginis]|nr:hypothetical protein [Endobacter medicaginis]NVN29306.1 hypothetical protein [Endobacter medicaginis]
MSNRLPAIRPLPLTMLALFALLVCKSAGIVYAATALLQSATDGKSDGRAPAAPGDSVRASDALTGLPARLAPSPAGPATSQGKPGAAPASAQPPASDEHELADELARQRQELALRSPAADARDDVLNTAQSRLQQKLDDLAQRQKAVDSAESRRADVDAETWTNLAKMYEAMAPKSAAGIFDVTEPRLLVNIVDHMNVRKAAAILAVMQPERARIATQMLALSQSNARPAPVASGESAAQTAAAKPATDVQSPTGQ